MRVFCQSTRAAVLQFCCDDEGAATVDFVVLTAAVVGLSIAIYTLIGDATDDHADRIGGAMSTMGVKTY